MLPGQEAAFVDWDRRFAEAVRAVPGFVGTDTLAPAPPEQPEWITTTRWEAKADMLAFADSDLYKTFESEGNTLRDGQAVVRVFEGGAPSMPLRRGSASLHGEDGVGR